MSRNYKFRDQTKPYFISFATVGWIDVFVRHNYAEILLESIQFCQKKKGLLVYAWVIMPSHVHMIIGTSQNPMQDIIRDFKSFTSRVLRKEIEQNYSESRKNWMIPIFNQSNVKNQEWQFWQHDNHLIELDYDSIITQKLTYLHENPVKAGFVLEPQDWLLSSARDYCGNKGLLDVILVE